ncbi:MAG: excinuclease ABC subunit UvrC [Deltaproteobacteria bacterium]|nr:excinuclease ABC subunit UvrC [Deltaproteobacteria bacterium]MBW1920049.1 excinuclease ABC subunit UvrC [Deltaproteobacteria bacterium]MBW1978409.1 excinuclease ABC subunit UvrC [Deltaproteobacteria bacterium]MBW2045631.1 excinuclease ABC subunit UvrC [Deltaproteobacteria bacterium]MBW2300900.1 excinuclease ABC subunit UvrC [Deltaproteobacteria bacterium]
MDQAPSIQYNLDPESLKLQLPEAPGVYLFKDDLGQILYIGKAKNLKKRVLTYFKSSGKIPHKTEIMINRARGLGVILTSTEKEAFILESNLIKKHLPRYNIILRDDKQYPWLRLDIKEPYPRLSIVRKPKKDGARYFGPFSSAQSVRQTLKLIDRVFQLRKCKSKHLPKRSRPCLNYQLGRCLGPCTHDIPLQRYKEVVKQVSLFLEGRNLELIKAMKKSMEEAAEKLDFEKAARTRDRIRAVERTIERQHVASAKSEDLDVVGLAQKNGAFQLAVLFVRKGYLTGSRDYFISSKQGSPPEVIEAFLKQYYPDRPLIPGRILVSESVEDIDGIEEWMSEIAGKRVHIEHPRRGEKLRLLRMAVANAESLLSVKLQSQEQKILSQTQSTLKLRNLPRSVEGLDVSNISGKIAVGAFVSFLEGKPYKAGYRNYRIKGVEGIDDYAMVSEILARRLSREPLPDLFVIDGGKGHLQAAKKVVDNVCKEKQPELVAIAKKDDKGHKDRIFLPGRKNALTLRDDHPVLHFLMRIRDEAHRRAITHHRKLRGKVLKESILDEIPGIGEKRKKELLESFGDVEAISRATVEELSRLKGISTNLAENILKYLGARRDTIVDTG